MKNRYEQAKKRGGENIVNSSKVSGAASFRMVSFLFHLPFILTSVYRFIFGYFIRGGGRQDSVWKQWRIVKLR